MGTPWGKECLQMRTGEQGFHFERIAARLDNGSSTSSHAEFNHSFLIGSQLASGPGSGTCGVRLIYHLSCTPKLHYNAPDAHPARRVGVKL